MNREIEQKESDRLKEAYLALQKAKAKIKAYEDREKEPIAVIGMSCKFPKADNPQEFWNLLCNGVDAVTEVPKKDRWDSNIYYHPDRKKPNKSYSKWGGFLDDIDKFDPLFFNISPKEAEVMDPQQRLCLEECWKALEDAGYSEDTLSEKRIGVFVGVRPGDYIEKLKEANVQPNADTLMGNDSAILAARISYYLNLKGVNLSVDTACSSSLVAIHLACKSIQSGESETALAGGVCVMTMPDFYITTSNAGMLSSDGRCKTFDNGANGFVPGEGVGFLVLKSLKKAIEDRNNIYAVIKGSGVNQDGKTNGITAPNALSQALLENEVYERYAIDPETITYIETHGTGTKLGDPIEIEALTNTFRRRTMKRHYCALGSVKTNIGHTLAAAGVAGVIKILLSLRHKKIPPSINFEKANEHINFEESHFYVVTDLKDWKSQDDKPRRAAISSFGFSGTNCHMIIEEAPNRENPKSAGLSPYCLIPLSAKTERALKQRLDDFGKWLEEEGSNCSISDIAYTLHMCRSHFKERMAFVVKDTRELASKIKAIKQNESTTDYADTTKDEPVEQNAASKELGNRLITELKENKLTVEEYKDKLSALAKLYVGKYDLDWINLYQEDDCRRISLPGYPFARERYWIPETKKGQGLGQGEPSRLHPLIGHNSSTLKEQRFSTHLRGDEFYLTDHVVGNQKVLPGVAYIEMARAAGEIAGECRVSKLKNVVWARPVTVSGDGQEISISLYPNGESVEYEVISNGQDNERIVHSQGKLYYDNTQPQPQPQPFVVDIEAIKGRCVNTMDRTDCYKLFEGMGLKYGLGFQAIEELRYDGKEALARLSLPATVKATGYTLHPSLMDGALQAIAALIRGSENKTPFLPFSLGEVEILGELPERCYSYATISGNEKESSVKKFNIDITDDAGKALVRIRDFSVRALKPAAKSGQIISGRDGKNIDRTAGHGKQLSEGVDSGNPGETKINEKELFQKVQDDLLNTVSAILKIGKEAINVNENMSDYGFNSISLTDFAERLNDKYNLDLMPDVLYEYPTIDSFAKYLCKDHGNIFINYYKDLLESVDTKIQEDEDISITEEIRPRSRFQTQEVTGQQQIINEPIAIIGMAGVMPKSPDLETFWKNLEEGKDLISEVPKDRWDWKAYFGDPAKDKNRTNIKWGGFIEDIDKFDAMFFGISPREAKLMDPQQRIFLETVWKAIEDAGLKASDLAGTNTALFVGVGTSDYNELLKEHDIEIEGYTSTGTVHSVLANRVSYLLDIHGPSEPIDTACSSALVAIHRAVKAMHNGDCEMAIVGGVNALLSPTLYISFNKAGMLCEDGKCKTFDKAANGYVRGEGAGAIILKPLSRAESDGDYIYAVIKGTAENHGGLAISLTAPNPVGQGKVLMTAYERAGFDPDTVSYIEAHGSGTSLGDPIEIKGLKRAFNELYKMWEKEAPKEPHCGLGSVKTNIGHLETAAGIAGVIKVLLSMKHKRLPASINFKELNPYIELKDTPFYIVSETKDWQPLRDKNGKPVPRRAGVSSFGFGGANAHVVLEEYENPVPRQQEQSPQIVVLSAKNEDRLKEYAGNLAKHFSRVTGHGSRVTDIAYTLQVGREAMEERLAIIVSNVDELVDKLRQYNEGKTGIQDLYRGNIKKDKGKAGLLIKGETLEDFIKAAINKKNLPNLAELWVSGENIDWKLLYSNQKPRRISLPTYPFARERHWFASNQKRI